MLNEKYKDGLCIMKNIIIQNRGDDTLINFLKEVINKDTEIKLTVEEFSIYALYDLLKQIKRSKIFQVILTKNEFSIEEESFSKRYEIAKENQSLTGNNYEITLKNNMNSTYIARVIKTLIQDKVNFKLLKPGNNLTNQKEVDGEDRIYFIAETKESTNRMSLRVTERQKINAGEKHFDSLQTGIEYEVVSKLEDLH